MSEGGAQVYVEQFVDDPASVIGLIKAHPVYYGDALETPVVADDLGIPRKPRESTFDDLRSYLWEILFRLRLFPEAGAIPDIDVATLTDRDVQKSLFKYGAQLLDILGPRHLRQLEREAGAIEEGIRRYRKWVEKQRVRGIASDSAAGQNTIDRFVRLVAVLNKNFLIEPLKGKAGPFHIAANILRFIEPEVAAYITVKVAFDTAFHKTFEKRRRTPLIHAIGNTILAEIQVKRALYEDNAYYQKLMQSYRDLEGRKGKRGNEQREKILGLLNKHRATIRGAQAGEGISMLHDAADLAASCGWEMRDAVGTRLYMHLMEAARGEQQKYGREVPAFRSKQFSQGPGSSPAFIVAADWLIEEFYGRHDLECDRQPIIRPMTTFPSPWTTASAYTGILPGGYRGSLRQSENQQHLVKSDEHIQLDRLTLVMHRGDSPIFRALHGLQSSAFKINKRVLAVMELLKDTDTPAPVAPKERIDFAEKEKAEKGKIYTKWHREELPKRTAFINTLAEAKDNEDEPTIFFPHTFDYRGRVYPTGAYLNPQGNDISRGLLVFSEGKAIDTPVAADALAIHGANCYGKGIDKLPLPERRQWVNDHKQDIVEVANANNPRGINFWEKAKDRWQFLAFCYDWTDYCNSTSRYVSHLPVYVDGTCNGYQHMAALMRSRNTGKLVGMAPWEGEEERRDIYETAITFVETQVKENAIGGDATAQYILRVFAAKQNDESWLEFGRDLAKIPVMTYAYGSNQKGISDALQEKIKDKWGDSKIPLTQWELLQEKRPYYSKKKKKDIEVSGLWDFSFYLAGLFIKAINIDMAGASDARKQLETIGKKLAGVGKGGIPQPIRYTSPAGFPVVLAEYEMLEDRKEVEVLGERLRFDLQKPKIRNGEPLLDPEATAQGFPPHVVHSLDSAHLVLTIDRCLSEGMRSFATTHDCFGCLAADMPRMNSILRDAFIDMYRNLDMHSLAVMLAEENGIDPKKFRNIEVRGDLDLDYIRQSPTFFS